ncbi:hypothetical protein IJT17_05865 [bacterium]|nr:hypothetical protein [bacterium]
MINEAQSALLSGLVSASSYARLQALAPLLPKVILVGLECRLREEDEPVDLWICPGLDPQTLNASAPWLHQQSWEEFAPLAALLDSGSPPWPCAFGAWTTEFDLKAWDSRSVKPPLPSSFVTFSTARPRLNIADTVAALWKGERAQDMPPNAIKQLEAIISQCPRGELAGLGFLYPRPQQPARLMLRVQDLSDLGHILKEQLSTAQRLLEGLTSQAVIGIPFDFQQEARYSLEAYIDSPASWKELAERMVAQGYSTPAKAEAMLDLAITPHCTEQAMITLNHVKLALHGDGFREVKAYPSILSAMPLM